MMLYQSVLLHVCHSWEEIKYSLFPAMANPILNWSGPMANREEHPLSKGNTLSLGQQANWHAAVIKALPRDIGPELALNWERNGEALTKVLREALIPPKETECGGKSTYLHLLVTSALAATSNHSSIAEANAVFTGNLDPTFTNWGGYVADANTPETAVNVYEMRKDGDCRTLFGSLGNDPRSLCLTQGQIVKFCHTFPLLLRQAGHNTFFLYEAMDQLYVAQVRVRSGHLELTAYRLDYGGVWRSVHRHRLVVVQQTV